MVEQVRRGDVSLVALLGRAVIADGKTDEKTEARAADLLPRPWVPRPSSTRLCNAASRAPLQQLPRAWVSRLAVAALHNLVVDHVRQGDLDLFALTVSREGWRWRMPTTACGVSTREVPW